MNNELTLKIGSKNRKILLQNGFYSHTVQSTRLHKHNYAEIHVVANAQTPIIIDGKTYFLEDGNIVLIPKETSHCFKSVNTDHKSSGFQVDYPFTKLSFKKLPKELANEFLKEIDLCAANGDHTRIAAYISLFCSYFFEEEKLHATPINDFGFLIEEFFSNRYSEDVHLKDLAETLHLSKRQTERLVIKHTGRTFRAELVSVRLRTAKYLLATTSMTPTAVCEYVGYHSYAGFFKAMKKFDK